MLHLIHREFRLFKIRYFFSLVVLGLASHVQAIELFNGQGLSVEPGYLVNRADTLGGKPIYLDKGGDWRVMWLKTDPISPSLKIAHLGLRYEAKEGFIFGALISVSIGTSNASHWTDEPCKATTWIRIEESAGAGDSCASAKFEANSTVGDMLRVYAFEAGPRGAYYKTSIWMYLKDIGFDLSQLHPQTNLEFRLKPWLQEFISANRDASKGNAAGFDKLSSFIEIALIGVIEGSRIAEQDSSIQAGQQSGKQVISKVAEAASTHFKNRPIDGAVVKTFADTKREVVFEGEGRSVRAVGDGLVVWAQSGLRGYPDAIIIKHDADFLTVYANNKKMLVNKGDYVQQGSEIALAGPTLLFEVRLLGKAVDPFSYIPNEAAPDNRVESSFSSRLMELQKLFERGLISESEYEKKKEDILKSL